MSGCALVFAYRKFQLRAKGLLFFYLLLSALVLFGCLSAARTPIASMLGSDLAVGIAFTLFLFGVLQLELGAGSPRYPGVAHRFAGFSFMFSTFPCCSFFGRGPFRRRGGSPMECTCFMGA
jgi:hypothetical protein